MSQVDSQLIIHIKNKIEYHDELRKMHEANEEYLLAAKERDEVARLKGLLDED